MRLGFAVAIALGIALHAARARADAYVAKKDRERAAKAAARSAPPVAGTRATAVINLYNLRTRDYLAIDPAAPPSGREVNTLLRDHFTNQTADMEPRLIAALIAAARSFNSDLVHVVSGFRHPKYNLILRKKGHQVARDSQHTHGTAIDFAIPAVPTHALHAWAKAQKLGGVGVYPGSGFIHMDTGPIRFWSGD